MTAPVPQQPDEDDRDRRMAEALDRGMPAGLASLAIYGPDALRTQLAEVIRAAAQRAGAIECDMTVPGEHADADCPSCSSPVLPFATVDGVIVSVYADIPELLDLIAPTIGPFLARACAEGAAEALREAAEELNTPDQAIEIALSGADHVYDHLRDKAAALSAPTTTEGDPT